MDPDRNGRSDPASVPAKPRLVDRVRVAAERLPLHVALFAAFPVLFLYEFNMLFAPPSELPIPLTIALLAAAIVWGLSWLFLRNLTRSALMASGIVIVLETAGRILYGVPDDVHAATPPPQAYAFGALVLVGIVGLALVLRRSRGGFPKATLAANFIALALVLQSAGAIAESEVTRHTFSGDPILLNGTGPKPDIYLIVLDEYSAPEYMEKTWGYNDSGFTQNLSSAGFQVLNRSTANYPITLFSLASMLNMQYLPADPVTRSEVAMPMVRNPITIASLRTLGYKWVHFDTNYEPTIANANADLNVECGISDFQIELIHETALRPLQSLLIPEDVIKQDRINCQFDQLANLPSIPNLPSGPLFVFDHFLVPHSPYVFGPAGQSVSWGNNLTLNTSAEKTAYREQVQYTNNRTLTAIHAILAHSKTPPVILLFSDDGEVPWTTWDGSNASVNATMRNLAAVYNPGHAALPANLSLVNVFRYLLNEDFGANLPILPTENWYFTGDPNELLNRTSVLQSSS
ncbi:MAG: hypothetical protein ACYDDF_14620 [Thermoplasmatota archaeon]